MERLKSDVQQYVQPAIEWQERPSPNDDNFKIARAFFIMRAANGILGMLLPLIVIIGEIWWFGSGYSLRGSVSAYYHSGMRDVFVGILCVVGFFLILHRLFEGNLENYVTIIAGIAAFGVAFFPTSADGKTDAWTHWIFAFIFVTGLGLISAFFGFNEGESPELQSNRKPRLTARLWKSFHLLMAGAIALAGGFILLMGVWDASDIPVIGWLDKYSVLIGEITVAFAFGLSWLTKGTALEVDLFQERKAANAARSAGSNLRTQDATG